MTKRRKGLTAEELAAQAAADLPEREALTLVDPSTLLGSSSLPTTSGTPAAGTPTTPAPAPNINLPHLPVPTNNPGGTYQPDASASSQT